MKLHYRGVEYTRTPYNLEIIEGEIAGKYRGQDWQHHYPRHMVDLQPKVGLQYRGVPYKTCQVAKEPVANIEVQRQQLNQSFERTQPRAVIDEAEKIHLDNMRRNLERRLQVAKASGNDSLVQILEKESQDLALL
jgi:hypothetical protein